MPSHSQDPPSPSSSSPQSKNAYATLLTRPSYLAGAILLAYTLTKHSPTTPLIILYTPETLPEESIAALRTEARHSNVILRAVEHLRLPEGKSEDVDVDGKAGGGKGDGKGGAGGMVAERFIDTWTKLRVFQLPSLNISKLCFLDADMMIFRDPSPLIFEPPLTENHLLASHVCVCNLDHDAWAPSSWNPENCAFTPISNASDIAPAEANHPTRGIMNTGTFVFRPSASIEEKVLGAFQTATLTHLKSLKFPDQDFLNEVFAGDWDSLHWSCNALKTWRYWHGNFWRDREVRVLHYIVDKPWARRVERAERAPLPGAGAGAGEADGEEEGVGKAGYKGLDGVTHSWWWAEYARWKAEREKAGDEEKQEVVRVGRYVAGEQGDENEELSAVGGGAQNFAKRWEDGEKGSKKEGIVDGSDDGKDEQEKDSAVGGPVLRKPMLGERGHGPVVRGFSSGGERGGRGLSHVSD